MMGPKLHTFLHQRALNLWLLEQPSAIAENGRSHFVHWLDRKHIFFLKENSAVAPKDILVSA